jgi:hypothetical protein
MEKQFEYVNNYYGLKLRKHSPVVEVKTGKRGQVVKGDGAHIHIQWDGAKGARGPYPACGNAGLGGVVLFSQVKSKRHEAHGRYDRG